jgi:hypothetical protein
MWFKHKLRHLEEAIMSAAYSIFAQNGQAGNTQHNIKNLSPPNVN